MIKKTVKIQLKNGLEARPVAVLVQIASQHESSALHLPSREYSLRQSTAEDSEHPL